MSINFSAGPAVLPECVLEEVAANMVDYHGSGMSLLEMSHRGTIFAQIHRETLALLRELLSVPENALHSLVARRRSLTVCNGSAELVGGWQLRLATIVNGVWSKKAAAEAAKFCHVNVLGTGSGRTVPPSDSIDVPNDAAYLYYCQNETVNGLEFNYVPECPELCSSCE